MMICPQCLSQATGRVLVTGSLLKWRTNSFQSSTKFLRGGLSATADGRIPSRSYHRSASLAANQPLQPSTPTAHPSSTPTATSSVAEGVIATKTRPRGRKASCVPAGMPLKGISYLKNGSDPIAEADSEYPSWLWACLDEQGKGNETDERVGDLYSKSKKERRQAAKRLRKLVASNPAQLAPKIPLVERSIDLPSNPQHSIQGAIEASEARQELTRALRAKRRASIKEKNFLKGMR